MGADGSGAAALAKGILELLREAYEGGRPGAGTGFVENTRADGGGNGGLFATLESLTAEQASRPMAHGTSVAAHASHLAYSLEVTLRWLNGDRGPFDWPGSFEPRVVDEPGWRAARARMRTAYDAFVAWAGGRTEWDEHSAGGIAAGLAHSAYHLGAIRQIAKLSR